MSAVAIPRVIYQTHKCPISQLPDRLRHAVSQWKVRNPDYAYRYFDDDEQANYVEQNYSTFHNEIYELLKARSGSSAADFWRMLILFREGGVYADADSRAFDLDAIVRPEDQFLTFSDSDAESAFGSHFAPIHSLLISKPQHVLIGEAINEICVYHIARTQRWARGDRMPVEFETGPGCYNRAWMRVYGRGLITQPCTVGSGGSSARIINRSQAGESGWRHKAYPHEEYLEDLKMLGAEYYL